MAYESIWSHRKDEVLAIAAEVQSDHLDAWAEVKVPGQHSRRYINLVSQRCIAAGIPAGVNLKRGGPEESLDALAFPNASGAGDSTGTYAGLEIVDIVISAESPNAHLGWGDVTQVTIDAGTIGGWKAGTTDTPEPQPPAGQPYPDERTWWPNVFDVEVGRRYAQAGLLYPDNAAAFRWASRTAYDIAAGMTKEDSLAKHLEELEQALGLP